MRRPVLFGLLLLVVVVGFVCWPETTSPAPLEGWRGPVPSTDEVVAAFEVGAVVPEVVAGEGDDRVVVLGPHELVVPGRVWRQDVTAITDGVALGAVEPGSPAPRWAALAGCDVGAPRVLVLSFDTGEVVAWPDGTTFGPRLGCRR